MTDSNLDRESPDYQPSSDINDLERGVEVDPIVQLNSRIDGLFDVLNQILVKLNEKSAPTYVVDVKGDITLRPE